MLKRGTSYEATRAAFRWRIPERFNIATAICDAHATGDGRPALIAVEEDGRARTWSFDALKTQSSRLANVLLAHGIGAGDRVGILIPQRVETLLAHLAIYRIGAIALPLFTQFGPDALEHRLGHSGARALVTDGENLVKLDGLRDRLPDLATVLLVDGPGAGLDLWREMERASDRLAVVDTRADDPAMIIYTSGTTGKPKGALHGHRVLLGHMPGVELPHEFFPVAGDRFWTPADWAWAGGLLDVLLPSLFHGIPVVAQRARKFDPEQAFDLMARHGVRNAFMPPTALKLMRQVANPRSRFGYALRSIGSGGEALGEDVLAWGRETFGLTINEFYGQTEANLVVGNCASLFPVRPGSMGRAIPGHTVAVIGEDGRELPRGEAGQIAVLRPDPVMLLDYWRQPEATAAKFRGDWLLTGDTGIQDADGYFWYKGRDDDLISSGGYRIGPTDIEDTILKHPAVLMAAVIGKPDPVRGEIVKAFIVLRPAFGPDEKLSLEIQSFVRTRLAHYQYPREVEFISELPLTATGKIRRNALRDKSAT